MAKKPLGVPLAAAGPEYDFFMHMQAFVLACGDLSLAAMASKVHVSRQVLHRALRGPDLPSRDLVERIVDSIHPAEGDETAEATKQAKKEALDAYSKAVASQRDRVRVGGMKNGTGRKQVGQSISGVAAAERERLHDLLQLAHRQGNRPPLKILASQLNLSTSTINDWMLGKSVPRDFRELERLFDLLARQAGGRTEVVTRAEAERLWNSIIDAQANARRRARRR